MRKGNKLIQEGKVPKKRTLNTQVLTDIVNGYYLDGIEVGHKVGFEDGYHAAQEDGQKIYQKGLDDAWDAARKLTHPRYDGYRDDEKKEIFGFIESDLILIKMSASEAIEKIREYEEKQKQEEAKERFREKLESGCFSGKQKQSCDNCVHYGESSDSDACFDCVRYEQKQEGRSGYVSFEGEKPQEQGVTTVFPDSPCDLCVYNPPGSGDGKPCTMCPAEGRID